MPSSPITRLALSRRRNYRSSVFGSTTNSSDFSIPFSWSLFFLAVLQFSVWSLGVYEAHAKSFFASHTSLIKTCDNCERNVLQDLIVNIPNTQQAAIAEQTNNLTFIQVLKTQAQQYLEQATEEAQLRQSLFNKFLLQATHTRTHHAQHQLTHTQTNTQQRVGESNSETQNNNANNQLRIHKIVIAL